jgi:hypothetical protein
MAKSVEEQLADVTRQLRQREEELDKARAEAAAQANRPVRIAVAKSGGVMLLGIRSFPVTYYKSEWLRILGAKDEILSFIEKNDTKLSQGKKAAA